MTISTRTAVRRAGAALGALLLSTLAVPAQAGSAGSGDERPASGASHFALAGTGSPVTPATRLLGGPAGTAPRPVAASLEDAEPQVVQVGLDVDSIEAYWYFASGVALTASGFEPGETVRITDTSPSGAVFELDPRTADAAGSISAQLKALDPDVEVGPHTIAVVGETSGGTASVPLAVAADPGATLRASASPASLTQDEIRTRPVSLRVEGLGAYERVFVNLFGPDGSGTELSQLQYFRGNRDGVFVYDLQARTADMPTGEWMVSFISDSGQSGSATFVVTHGAPRSKVASLDVERLRITQADFDRVGASFSIAGFPAFTAVDVSLTTPQGYEAVLGTSRTDGDGRLDDKVTGTRPPTGVYTLRATSVTTGNYAEALFVMTDGFGSFELSPFLVGPESISAVDLARPDGGLALSAYHLEPFAGYYVTLRDPLGRVVPMRKGQTDYVNADESGRGELLLSTRVVVEPGVYTVSVQAGFPATTLRYRIAVTGPAGVASTPGETTATPTDPSDGTGTQTPGTPVAPIDPGTTGTTGTSGATGTTTGTRAETGTKAKTRKHQRHRTRDRHRLRDRRDRDGRHHHHHATRDDGRHDGRDGAGRHRGRS